MKELTSNSRSTLGPPAFQVVCDRSTFVDVCLLIHLKERNLAKGVQSQVLWRLVLLLYGSSNSCQYHQRVYAQSGTHRSHIDQLHLHLELLLIRSKHDTLSAGACPCSLKRTISCREQHT